MREHYFVPEGVVELRAFTHGLMPRSVPEMMRRFTDDWQRLGVDAWNEVPNHWRPGSGARVGWWTLPEYLGDAFVAPLLGAPAGTCILQPNVHWTVQCLLSAPEPFASRRTVVTTALEFPSVLHSVRRWTDLLGLRLLVAPPGPDGYVDRDAVLEAVDDDTAFVFLSHVGFTTGERLPDAFLRAVADRVHTHGGLLAVDGYHATGSLRVNVEALGADLYFGGLLKEASGSSGNAYLYLRPGLELTPRLTGWVGDAEPFGFAETPAAHADVRRRFLGGTPAVASLYHAVEGLRLLLGAGLEQVEADWRAKTDYVLERMDAAGLPLHSPRDPDRRSVLTILEVPAADRLCHFLKLRGIFTDSRKGRYLRLAPFVWNTPEELVRTFDVLEAALASRAYLHAPTGTAAPGPVT